MVGQSGNRLFAGDFDGETRTRAGDTTIFSRVLSRRVVGVPAER
jgi:hypothetical protein